MKTHVHVVAMLNIIAGVLHLLAAAAVFLIMCLVGGVVASQGDHGSASILGVVALVVGGFLALLGVPGLLAGWGLFAEKVWARPLSIILGVFHLLSVPIGTAIGIYTLWVFLQEQRENQMVQAGRPIGSGMQPVA